MKKTIAFYTMVLMLFSLFLYPIVIQAQQTEAQTAAATARRDASQDVSVISWGIGGFFCSIFAVAYAYLDKPTVPADRLVGKSPEYVAFYTDTYLQEAKKQRSQSALIGCLANSILTTVTTILTTQQE